MKNFNFSCILKCSPHCFALFYAKLTFPFTFSLYLKLIALTIWSLSFLLIIIIFFFSMLFVYLLVLFSLIPENHMEDRTVLSLSSSVPSFARGLKILLVHNDTLTLVNLSCMLEKYSFRGTERLWTRIYFIKSKLLSCFVSIFANKSIHI